MSITSERKQELIQKFAKSPKDTGSVEVQCSILTERIQNLTEHLKKFKHDHSSRRGLLMLVGQRKRLMKYLSNEDMTRYQSLLQSLNLRK